MSKRLADAERAMVRAQKDDALKLATELRNCAAEMVRTIRATPLDSERLPDAEMIATMESNIARIQAIESEVWRRADR